MGSESVLGMFRSFFGLSPRPPRNYFRNPIWMSDDDEDDDDELFSREHNPMGLPDVRNQIQVMHEIFQSLEGMFGNFKSFFDQDSVDSFSTINDGEGTMSPYEPDSSDNNAIRNFYLKPSVSSNHNHDTVEDKDLDGKLSHQEVMGLLNKKNQGPSITLITPFDGNRLPGGSYSKTIITTCLRRPDGTVETRKIVKNGNEIVEETTTTSEPDTRSPQSPDE